MSQSPPFAPTMHDVIVKKFTFTISSFDEFPVLFYDLLLQSCI